MNEHERMYHLLKDLTEACGVSGFEDEVRQVIVEKLKEYSDEVRIDPFGNVIAVIKGENKDFKVMLAAHMDEIGLMVTHIEKNGFIRFTTVGGVNALTLIGQRVVIQTRKGKIKGVIGMKPPHLMTPEEAKKVPEIKNLFIDVGASNRSEVEKLGIRVGDVVVIDRDIARLGNGKIVTGRAFDDRAGVAVMIDAMMRVYGKEPSCTVYAVATVQEEVGCRGARVVAFRINPTMAIAIDVTAANDVAGVSEHEYVTRLGAGPAIKIMDNVRGGFLGLIAHPKVRELLIRVAEEEKIPYQLEVLVGGSTDASTIHLVREGVPSGVISIPTRYVHSSTEVISLDDAVNAAKLIAATINKVKPEDLKF
ncbi:MAG: M42 family peptidase [Thermoprotei archaeon]|nr:MAG: M42 family peptidase [Thermoprotei archaeon]RLF19433.1 MAG: M42 family peptidase [Thermoprotei archaeon]